MSDRKYESYDENAPGPFYVERDSCIICRAPEWVAPDLIGFVDDETGRQSHCYLKRQPEAAGETARAVRAIAASCCGTYHYAGDDPEVKKMLKAARCTKVID